MTTIREKGKQALSTVIKQQKNIDTFEKYIHKQAEKMAETEDADETNYDNEYKKIMYQVIGDMIKINEYKKSEEKSKEEPTIKKILKNVKKGLVGWKHPVFENITKRIEEQDEFIINPFEVEEGVTTCNNCGSKRVFTYSKLCRGADEPLTTFATCVKCKSKWTYSG